MLQFSKYQGLGNDFLMLDGRLGPAGEFCFELTAERVQRLCDRRFGIGADGVILALPPQQGGELRMRIFNADGTEPEMCGNGIRCLARFLADSDGDGAGRLWQVETLAGRIVPQLQPDGSIRVDMGEPCLTPEAVPTTLELGPAGIPQGDIEASGQCFAAGAVGMGNPHVVIPVADLQEVELEAWGAALEVHPAFPARTNVHFVQVLAPDHLVMRVWERGAGPTLACGTGACATLVVCHQLRLCERAARLDLPGGSLQVSWDPANNHLYMTGPAEAVFDAVISPSLWGDDSSPPQAPGVDCATACSTGCVRPEACASADARQRVEALLASTSLDDLVALASDSLESRTRARAERSGYPFIP